MSAMLIGAVLASGCGKKSDAPAAPRTETFASWDAFLASDARTQAKRGQVVLIGIDAGVWRFMDRLIAEGRLPNLARIKREGAYGPLASVENYVTPPAWTSMLTGYLPEKTGVYTFGYWDREHREFISGNSNDVLVPMVWDAASRAGLKAGVFNVPMTYPPHRVNGAMVSGQMTPVEVKTAVPLWAAAHKGPALRRFFRAAPGVVNHSPPAPGLVEDSLNAYIALLHDTVDDGREVFDTVSLSVMSKDAAGEPDEVLAFETFPVGKYSPWLPFDYLLDGKVVRAFNRIKIDLVPSDFRVEVSQTAFPIDAAFTYPEELAATLNARFNYYLPTMFLSKEVVPTLTEDMAEYASFFYDYDDWDLFCFVFTQPDNIQHLVGYSELSAQVYETIDRLVGEIMGRMPAGATLIVASDHGSGEYDFGIDMNQLLHEMKLLEWTTAPDIDHDRTVVFHNLWHLYFNDELLTREELARRGYEVPSSVEPRDWLVERLRRVNVRTADGTRSFAVEASPIPDGAAGPAPDMIVRGGYGDHTVEFWNIMNPRPRVMFELVGSERYWHTRDGVYLVWGEGVREGFDGGAQDIQNIAPTILYLLGIPIGQDMDGRAMTDLFAPKAVAKRPLLVNRTYRELPRESVDPDAARESLQERLRSLGYVQ